MLKLKPIINTLSVKKIVLCQIQSLKAISTRPNEDGSEELRIETPWGHVAGKRWGPSGGKKVLAVHGWQDNAGTFDTLAPLLDKELEIYAIDLPGHGLSSHFPKGRMNHTGEYLAVIHRVVKSLSLENFIYMGHSLGAILGYIYCATFPELVSKYIAIENLKPITTKPTSLVKINRRAIDGLLELENKLATTKNFKGYTKEEAAEKMMKLNSFTLDSANILLKRGLKPSPSGDGRYIYTRDLSVKLKSLEFGASTENLLTYGASIKCDILHIKARPGIDYEPIDLYRHAVEEIRKTAASLTYYEVEGSHHVHLNNPERIAPYINDFVK